MDIGLFLSIFLAIQFVVAKKDRVTILGWICTSVSIAVLVPPINFVIQVVLTRNVESMPIALTVSLILSATLWFFYDFLVKNIYIYDPNGVLIISVNAIGCVIETVYVIVFITYAPVHARRSALILLMAMDISLFLSIVLAIQFVAAKKDRVTILEWICTSVSIVVLVPPINFISW
ncbi:hypothetical protein P8452_72820 [Trifolium repens]|nr:hypothetical protein P8452_72820 [Trifolium repens]